MTVPTFLSLSGAIDGDVKSLIAWADERLAYFKGRNAEAQAYYEGRQDTEIYGISIPPNMRNVKMVVGWGGTVVDVLNERLSWLGWTTDDGDQFDMDSIFAENALNLESKSAHLDALINGVSFVSVGSGLDGEPSPLITAHSPDEMTAEWDRRRRRIKRAFLRLLDEEGQTVGMTIYSPNDTTTYRLTNGAWMAEDVDEHNLGRVPVVMLPNRVRISRDTGRSEITRAVRCYTDDAVRTLTGLEVHREFYNAPQRFGLNMSPEDFIDPSGNPVDGWTSIQGRFLMAPPPTTRNGVTAPEPKVQQFPSSSPAPYLDQIKGYAMLLAAEAGIPSAYLGYQTENPSSADAIRSLEARLIKRAEDRQESFGHGWKEIGALALLIRDGAIPDEYASTVSVKWKDAATPTRAASADEAAKLVGAKILPADSTVTYDRIGLSPQEQRRLLADKDRAKGQAMLDKILGVGQPQPPEQQPEDESGAQAEDDGDGNA